MMDKPFIQSLVFSRFDVTFTSSEELLDVHKSYFGDAQCFENARTYLTNRLDFLAKQIRRNEPVFSSNLFHAVLGSVLTGEPMRKENAKIISEYVLGLRDQGGFLCISRDYVNQFPKLRFARNNPMVPEVYSSYYSFFLLKMLDISFSRSDLENIISWVIAHQKNSGAIFNSIYSNTPEDRRFEAEVASQTYFGANLILSIFRDLPEFDLNNCLVRAKNWALKKWLSLRTVAGRYFALKTIYLVAPDQVTTLGTAEAIGFLEDRVSPEGVGYYDYRLADKIDEFMSSSSSTELDKISSHVFSTYYAISMLQTLSFCGVSVNVPHERIKQLAKIAANPDCGFGMKVMVKDFREPFGPISTELETVLILLFPLLAQKNIAKGEGKQ